MLPRKEKPEKRGRRHGLDLAAQMGDGRAVDARQNSSIAKLFLVPPAREEPAKHNSFPFQLRQRRAYFAGLESQNVRQFCGSNGSADFHPSSDEQNRAAALSERRRAGREGSRHSKRFTSDGVPFRGHPVRAIPACDAETAPFRGQ